MTADDGIDETEQARHQPAPGGGTEAAEPKARGDHRERVYVDDLSYEPLSFIDTLIVTFED